MVRGARYQADTTWTAAHKKEAELWALFVALVNLEAPAVIFFGKFRSCTS